MTEQQEQNKTILITVHETECETFKAFVRAKQNQPIYRASHSTATDYTFSQVYTEHSPGLTTCWATRQALANLRKLKSYQASFLITCYEMKNKLQGKTLRNTNM